MYLGLDLGTTNVKTVVLRDDGSVVARAAVPVSIAYEAGGAVEQDMGDIWSATLEAISQALSEADPGAIKAIGICSQGGALQILDEPGVPVGPVISWQDGRGGPYDDDILAELGADWFLKHTGSRTSGTTIGQILRLQAEGNLPHGHRVGYVGDQIAQRLCGRAAHDATSLSLAMLYNPQLDRTDPELITRLGLTESRLPELIGPREAAGSLRPDLAERWGLPANLPVSCAVHDQYAAALCVGAIEDGDAMIGTGTAWVLLAVSNALPAPATDGAFLCRHIVDGRFGQLLSLLNGGSSLTSAVEQLGLDANVNIDALIADVAPGADGLSHWPFLLGPGEGLGPDATARFMGRTPAHSNGHVLRAVLEGLVFELNRYLGFLQSCDRIILCGAAAASRLTPQIVADVTGLAVGCIPQSDASAIGAGMLARAVVEVQTPFVDIVRQMKPSGRLLEPGKNREIYAGFYKKYEASLPYSTRGAQ
jgi:xylulokinase